MPLVGEDRVEPRVVRAVAHGVVVEERARLVQVVQHLRLPPDVSVEHALRHLERQPHRIAVVVVPHVFPRVDRARRRVVRVLLLPLVHVHHVVAAVGLGDRRDERDDVLADVPDVGAVVHGQAVGQFHQRRRRAGLARVDGAVDVVHRRHALRDRVGHRVVHLDRAWVGQLGQVGLVLVELRHQGFRGDGDDDHLPAVFGRPDGVDLHPRRELGEEAHVVVHLLRVRQLARRACDVAEDGLRRRHGLGRRHVVDDGRQEEGLGGVLLDLLRVLLVDRLAGETARPGRGKGGAPGRGRLAGLALGGRSGEQDDLAGGQRDRHQEFSDQVSTHYERPRYFFVPAAMAAGSFTGSGADSVTLCLASVALSAAAFAITAFASAKTFGAMALASS